jgi:hypothetical protein
LHALFIGPLCFSLSIAALLGQDAAKSAADPSFTGMTSALGVRAATLSGDKRLRFGIGGELIAQNVEIRWPDGIVQRLENVPSDQVA